MKQLGILYVFESTWDTVNFSDTYAKCVVCITGDVTTNILN